MAEKKNLPVALDPKELEGLTDEDKEELMEMYKEGLSSNLDGEQVTFPQIAVLHQAGLFQMPDGTNVPKVEAIILYKTHALAYWKNPLESGETSPPDCFSRDGLHPDIQVMEPQARECRTCQWNQFGSAGGNRRGKACRNRRRLFLWMEGHEVPFMLSIPPASLRNFGEYMVLLTDLRLAKDMLPTVFELDVKKGTFTYSELQFTPKKKASGEPDLLKPVEYLKLRKSTRERFPEMEAVPIVAEEFMAEEEFGDQSKKDDDLPF